VWANSGGLYQASGTLEGITPGRRTVYRLEIRRLTSDAVDGLTPLLGFKDLRILTIERSSGIDLTPLTQLRLDRLRLVDLADTDLAPLGALSGIADLALYGLHDDCRIPETLTLPSSVEGLGIGNDGRSLSGAPVKQLIEAIDWSRLSNLRDLGITVGGNEPLEPIHVDLGFLRHLQQLERLDMFNGVWHNGQSPSPLEPPFDGLPHSLSNWLRIDAWNATTLEQQLREHFGLPPGPGPHVSVHQRYAPEPDKASWTITPLDADDPDSHWSTYGSFCDAFDGTSDDTEHDALQAAKRRIRKANPTLLKRLDFDPESSGTGITAPTRHDLQAMLDILDIDTPA